MTFPQGTMQGLDPCEVRLMFVSRSCLFSFPALEIKHAMLQQYQMNLVFLRGIVVREGWSMARAR